MTNRHTLAMSSHRLETIPLAEPLMRNHEVIVLEEPKTPGFEEMLEGNLPVDDYLMAVGPAFPRFAKSSYLLVRALHQEGRSVVQLDPFLDELADIHDFFADGGRPEQIDPASLRGQVYGAERSWTESLVEFYRTSRENLPFSDVIKSVEEFARADALRGRLRDELRAKALVEQLPVTKPAYIEAGYIHLWLHRRLRERLGDHLQTKRLLESISHERTGRRQVLGPGDHLTNLLTLKPDKRTRKTELLAARSVIHNRIIIRDELEPTKTEPFPHTKDEIRCGELVAALDAADCQHLYPLVHRLEQTDVAIHIVEDYLRRVRGVRVNSAR